MGSHEEMNAVQRHEEDGIRKLEVWEHMDLLEMDVAELENVTSQLIERLQPVLGSRDDMSVANKPDEAGCALANAVQSCHLKVENVIHRIDLAIYRLEI